MAEGAVNETATRSTSLCLIALMSWWLVSAPRPALADIYKYVDSDGVIHFTNMPTQGDYRKVPASVFQIKQPRQNVKISPEKPFWFSFGKVGLCAPHTNFAYDQHIADACQRYGLDHRLVKAVIKAESAFDPFAVSPKGAQGLMQLMPATSRDMGVLNPFDPQDNI
jgi:soluble lytic murein transglycosylase